MILADFTCDVCGESSRYTPPFVDVALNVSKARGREQNPPQQWAGIDPLFKAIMERGILQPEDRNGQRRVMNELHLGGCCLPKLGTPEGRRELLDTLERDGKLVPRSAGEHGVLDEGARVLPPPIPGA